MTTINFAQFDSLKLVHERQTLAGAMPVAGFVRLAEGLQDSSGTLDYQLRGEVDGQDRPLLKLRIAGTLQLQCQRCLGAFEHKVDFETALRLVDANALDAEYDDDPRTPDCIAASTAFDLAALIEDEVLLALPPYPRHEAGRCSASAAGIAKEAGAKILAFSALQALKAKQE